MTKQEFKQVYDLLDAVYELNFEPRKLDVWYEALKAMSHEKAMLAASKYIETEKYKPKPADIVRVAAEVRPSVKNQPDFKCELCSGGLIGVERQLDNKDKTKLVFFYRCKCQNGLSSGGAIPIITDDILNSRHRDVFGIYRLEPSELTAVRREDFRRSAQQIGRW